MRKIVFLFIALIPLFQNCQKDNPTETTVTDPNVELREIAWNAITSQEKATVNVDWKQAPVALTKYQDKSAYSVQFNTKDNALLGPIIVYIDASTKVVLGFGGRD
jgi:hypothetical protein